jgi:hypothetical protein
MKRILLSFCLAACFLMLPSAAGDNAIAHEKDAPPLVRLAAKELQRYLYLRTGEKIPILPGVAAVIRLETDTGMPEEAYRIESSAAEARISGGSPLAVLQGAYRFLEHMGIRFYMHGDVIPDERVALTLPVIDETRAPIFELRGIQPFHDFPEGPDWWNTDDYMAILAQLPKMGMNFFGLHTYPENRPAAEPTTWIGPPDEANEDGTVDAAYPAIYYNTTMPVGWGFHPKKTGAYSCGGALLFDRDDYSSEILEGLTPKPDTPEECVEVFARAGRMFNKAFGLARQLGVKTCLGTETPLVVPQDVADRILPEAAGLQPEGGRVAHFPQDMAGTDAVPLYQSVRFDLTAYRADLPDGVYTVTLHFCEPAHTTAGARVFGVKIEGNTVIESLDVLAEAGKDTALDFTFDDVRVQDGRIDIEFVKQTEFPCIAAIAVKGEDAELAVNCGGGAWSGYAADEDSGFVPPEEVERLYEGIFTRIMKTHPLDYYWFWTPETWTWQDVDKKTVEKTISDIRLARSAWERVAPPFALATCGWVLGPQYNRAYLDEVLPPDMAVSCINRSVGHDPVEEGFANVEGRGQWAIPWLEDDPAMTSVQLWAGRMRRDAKLAREYGCNGLMGIHWRTRILSPNVSALAQAAWDQSGWPAPADQGTGRTGGQEAKTGAAIENTAEDPLYQTVRWDIGSYHFNVPEGKYDVTLKFCEIHYDARNKRVFGVKIEDETVIKRLDIVFESGKNVARDYTFKDILVKDGSLDIEFEKIKEYPLAAAITVEGDGYERKINCAGPAWQEYEADLEPLSPHPPADDFYLDWALHLFGPEAAGETAAIFARMDGRLPRPSNWVGGPGGYTPDEEPWDTVRNDYAFVDELAALRKKVKGRGNRERFDYWLNNMEFLRATGKMRCRWHAFNQALEAAEKAEDPAKKKRLAREKALPARIALVETARRAYGFLLNTVHTTGAMGTVTNLEQHTLPGMLDEPAAKLEALLGEALPPGAVLPDEYAGEARLVVTTRRTLLQPDEDLRVKAAVLARENASGCVMKWRALGRGAWQLLPLEKAGRQTWTATLAAADIHEGGVEYYLEAEIPGTGLKRWPVTAPELFHTVVMMPE